MIENAQLKSCNRWHDRVGHDIVLGKQSLYLNEISVVCHDVLFIWNNIVYVYWNDYRCNYTKMPYGFHSSNLDSNHLLCQRWHFVGIFLARRWQMTLVRCHFVHRADFTTFIANGWFDFGPTPVAQQALHMLTLYQPFSFKYHVGPTLVRHDLRVLSRIINTSEKLYFPYFVLLFITVFSFSRSRLAFRWHLQ